MTLKEYLKKNEITALRFGRNLGLDFPAGVYRYMPRRGKPPARIPNLEVMERIYHETGGEVTPNDILIPRFSDPVFGAG